MNTVAVVDYGMGNLRSVVKALEYVAPAGTRVQLSDCPETVLRADRVVFPGQGAAYDCMQALSRRGLDEVIREVVRQRPFLGICMGMQVLLEHSEENGGVDCLGIFPGRVRRFAEVPPDASGARLKIPHMGWNTLTQSGPHPLWAGIAQSAYFYFVHSYYADPGATQLSAATSDYPQPFCCALAQENVFALQCHPEKSAQPGLTLLRNFMGWDGTR